MFQDAGKKENRIAFLCQLVTWFGKFIAPRRYYEAGVAEVEPLLRSLEAGGAEGWKVTQADIPIGQPDAVALNLVNASRAGAHLFFFSVPHRKGGQCPHSSGDCPVRARCSNRECLLRLDR